jgi:hypothetical protein
MLFAKAGKAHETAAQESVLSAILERPPQQIESFSGTGVAQKRVARTRLTQSE